LPSWTFGREWVARGGLPCRWASTAILPMSRTQTAPYNPAAYSPNSSAAPLSESLLLFLEQRKRPIAWRLVCPRERLPPPPAPLDAGQGPIRFRLARFESPAV